VVSSNASSSWTVHFLWAMIGFSERGSQVLPNGTNVAFNSPTFFCLHICSLWCTCTLMYNIHVFFSSKEISPGWTPAGYSLWKSLPCRVTRWYSPSFQNAALHTARVFADSHKNGRDWLNDQAASRLLRSWKKGAFCPTHGVQLPAPVYSETDPRETKRYDIRKHLLLFTVLSSNQSSWDVRIYSSSYNESKHWDRMQTELLPFVGIH
jgi:hypothetical protein